MPPNKDLVDITVNDKTLKVEKGTSILDVCKKEGIEIPVFCAHKKLSVAGNCRMCLVEVSGCSKLVASCAMPVSGGEEVFTESPRVKKARKGTLELLLINHPLDCPICDQGGECDLQDLTLAYGPSSSRFVENKRAVLDKNMGPLIKTVMNRCIHCMRCTRFAEEVAGMPEIGATGRGENVEITAYLEKAVTSPLSGNMIDLCPVGALTAKPHAFCGRAWEFEKTPSIDVHDALGSSIEIYTEKGQIKRILPRENDALNEEWITDKARFAFDGLKYQRLDTPYIREKGRLVPATWDEALTLVVQKMKSTPPDQIASLAGPLADMESLFSLKDLLDRLGVLSRDCRPQGVFLSCNNRLDYLFNTPLDQISTADVCLLIGDTLQWEAPLVATRIRRAVLENECQVGYVGPSPDLGFEVAHLSQKATVLNQIHKGEHSFATLLENAERPLIILTPQALKGLDGENIYHAAHSIAEKYGLMRENWKGFSVVHQDAGLVGGLDLGFTPKSKGFDTQNIAKAAKKGDIRFLYLLGYDEVTREDIGDAFVVYQGHHGDQGAHMADVVFPGLAHTEKRALYTNMMGIQQETACVTAAPGEAKEDWKIIRALSEKLKHTLPYDTREELLEHMPGKPAHQWHSLPFKSVRRGVINVNASSYYQRDVICRASPTMAQCVSEEKKK